MRRAPGGPPSSAWETTVSDTGVLPLIGCWTLSRPCPLLCLPRDLGLQVVSPVSTTNSKGTRSSTPNSQASSSLHRLSLRRTRMLEGNRNTDSGYALSVTRAYARQTVCLIIWGI